ncbi:hypothetical protein QVD17_26451 [Tagetes erecta]|uniref:Integrase catalytic domain-containing protein n=1 Tax=Tagetes erecta TaxID=13708 RepID=A0AAD8K6N0_TARER|nr:hypothetical protein QVD17_26451 [Tagetes erecta]
MDTGASQHITSDPGKITTPCLFPTCPIFVGNGQRLPVKGSGNGFINLPNRTYQLNNIIHSPQIIKDLLSVRKFTIDNLVSVEFDPFGFSLKDLTDGHLLSRHNSEGDLYPFTKPAFSLLSSTTPLPWHDRLGHPGANVLDYLSRYCITSCQKNCGSFVCSSCQLSNSKRLPFHESVSFTLQPFDIIHCDLWTSPVPSNSGYKYYMILVDNFTSYVWIYPLKYKSETFTTFTKFHKLIQTQFNKNIKTFQCDLGGEFNNNDFKKFANQQGLIFRFSCPQTSPQNGRSERMIRRINDIIRALLFHAHIPPTFWVEALHTATYLHNILPTKRLHYQTPAFALYARQPTYDHLRVFGCACYPNMSAIQPHKLSPRSIQCVFLGYPSDFRGYRCYDPLTGKVHLSRHVIFDEHTFPFHKPLSPTNYQFLDDCNPILHQMFHPPTSNMPSPSVNTTTAPLSSQNPSQPSPTTHTTSPPPSTHQSTSQPPPEPPSSSQPTTPTTQHSPTAPTVQQPTNTHSMTTRSKIGITKPNTRYNLAATTTISPVPTSYLKALTDPNWLQAMNNEYSALQVNNTWDLVPRPAGQPVIRSMWLFRHKFNSDGTLDRYKARLVCNGKSQTMGIDCTDTFSPVVKPVTIRTVLSLAVSKSWPIHQLDVKNAFLNGILHETVYMQQPPGFVDQATPDHVCRLRKSLYGLKQAPRAWYTRFSQFIHTLGFKSSTCDSSLFIYQHGTQLAYLLLYVDDIVITANDSTLLGQLIKKLSSEFAMTDLGSLHHFLGITVTRDPHSLHLAQSQYARDILHRANMSTCKPCHTPVDTSSKLSATEGDLLADGTLYRSLAGALQYLTITRPDIAYAVQQICLFMHAPREPHMAFLKRVLRYVKGTLHIGLRLSSSPSHSLTAYSDADWGGCPDTRRSTSGYCIYLGDNLISWSSKRQQTISRSSAEAEYRGVANAVAEATWIRNLLLELQVPVRQATIVYCDNISAIYLSGNPVQHQRTKHVEMDIHFVREKVQIGHIRVLHVPSSSQYADIFTKGLPRYLFESFRSSLNVSANPRSS